MRRSFKFLLRPTRRQEIALTACLYDHRDLYNAALEHRRTAYCKAGVTIRYGDQSAELKEIRKADPDGQGRWSAGSQQQTLRRLDKAFQASAWDSQPHDPVTRVYLFGIGHVRVHRHRPVKGTVKTISVKREGSRWYVVLSCDDVPAETLPATGAVAGVDMGVASLVTTSDGTHVASPRHLAATADRLAMAQRDLARKKRGGKRRRKAVARVAVLLAKVRRQRLDGAHKAANALVRDYDLIAHEALQVANMTKRAAPKPDGEGGYLCNGGSAKSGLNRSILDAGWGVFLTVLAHKAESAGREVIAVNPANTSRTCVQCGHCAKENRVSQAGFRCQRCGHEAHADVNAAINILRAGLALRASAQAA
ncbi:RNA-guided endonuclease InsQ/TnpB family protein [Nonomuraea fuscirosea]|uniref:RNA-guided endonuclease InsQ/TnpB family protein n=1 Tax=Nonomuraea fuscirosea TaxID=1291556 RepID=UPI0033F1293E